LVASCLIHFFLPLMLKPLLLIASCATLATTANALIRHALVGRFMWKGSVLVLARDAFALLQQPLFLLGLLVLGTSVALWMLIMATCELSFAYPAQIGLVIILTSLVSAYFFAEKLTPMNLVGLALILIGVALVRK
jgi:multidrug transporter EmrE-like cation transporter